MNEQSVIDAGRNIMTYDPLLGSLLILSLAGTVALFMWARSILKEKSVCQTAHLEDVRRFASETETTRSIVAANTEQLRSNTEATVKLGDLVRERLRT